MNTDDLAARLAEFISTRAPERGPVRVSGLVQAAGGASTENWFFDAHWPVGTARLMLRRAPQSEVVLVDRAAEFAVLRHLNDGPVPSPRAYWQGVLGGRFAMVLECCAGRAERLLLTPRNRMGLSEAQRLALAEGMADRLADLHGMATGDLAGPDAGFAAAALAPYRARLADLPAAMTAELQLGLWWLQDNLPADSGRCLVHGDYRPANVLVEDGRISAVLDWEFAHVGDPAEDLGWYLADVYRGQHFLPGRFGPDEFLARYAARRGMIPDRPALAWWAVFALQKLATIAVETLHAFRQGDDQRIIQAPDRHLSALMRAIARDGTLQGVAA